MRVIVPPDPNPEPKPVVTVAEELAALRRSLSEKISGCWERGEHPRWQPVDLMFLDRLLDLVSRIVDSLPDQSGV